MALPRLHETASIQGLDLPNLSADHPLLLETPLGIDFGRARIGLATCPGGFLSAPLKILDSRRRLWLELAEDIIEIAQQQGASAF